jgi:hypothetical protein
MPKKVSLVQLYKEHRAKGKRKDRTGESSSESEETENQGLDTKSTTNKKLKKTKDEINLDNDQLIESIDKKRKEFESVAVIKFNKQRVRVLSKNQDIDTEAKGILYWMSREQRVQGKQKMYKIPKSTKILKQKN